MRVLSCRVPPEVLRLVRESAQREGLSVSAWLGELVTEAVKHVDHQVDELPSELLDRLVEVGDRSERLGRKLESFGSTPCVLPELDGRGGVLLVTDLPTGG